MFKQETQGGLIVFTANVILKMDNNPTYLVHKALVDALKPIAQDYSDAFNAASNNDALLNMAKDRKYLLLNQHLESLAYHVDDVGKGDKYYILGAGFAVRKDVQALSNLPAPEIFKVSNHEKRGAITISWEKVVGKSTYIVEMRIVGEQMWQTIATPTLTTYTVENLQRGLHVEFRVHATGTRNIVGDYTRIIDVFVD